MITIYPVCASIVFPCDRPFNEAEIIPDQMQDLSNFECADMFYIPVRTIELHPVAILQKTISGAQDVFDDFKNAFFGTPLCHARKAIFAQAVASDCA